LSGKSAAIVLSIEGLIVVVAADTSIVDTEKNNAMIAGSIVKKDRYIITPPLTRLTLRMYALTNKANSASLLTVKIDRNRTYLRYILR